MFKKLTDLSFQRNWKQAIAFYVVMLFTLFVVASVLGVLSAIIIGGSEGEMLVISKKAGLLTSFVFSTGLAVLIVAKKSLEGVLDYFCVLLTALLSVLIGGIVSIIPVAYLTTRPTRKATTATQNVEE